jgi:hypothetical protein
MMNYSFIKKRALFPASAASAFLAVSMMLFLAGCGEKNSASEASPAESAANGTAPPASNQIAKEPVVIPRGQALTVRLLESISSRTARPGQSFEVQLAAPVVVDGKTILPKSTPLRGTVVSARASGRLHDPGYLRLTLDSIKTPEGNWVDIKTTSVQAEGKSHKKRNIALIGGGTGLGAAIGAIAGGGKGAAIGAISGAGAGTAGAYATGEEDVTFAAERKLTFTTVGETSIG